MADFYLRYVPGRRGLTGYEYIQNFLNDNYPDVDWTEIIRDGKTQFGKISATDTDKLSKCLADAQGRFSVDVLTEEELVGFAYPVFTPYTPPEGGDEVTFFDFMDGFGITVDATSLLASLRQMKRFLFKEIIKRQFGPNNDNTSDVAKIVILLLYHYNDLSAEDKATVDALGVTLKATYSAAMGIAAMQATADKATTILADYYTAKLALDAASTAENILAVEL